MVIRTQYKKNDKGAGRVTAKGGGKQRTVPYDHERTPAENHGDAAGELLVAHGWDISVLDDHRAEYVENGDGSTLFTFTHVVAS